MIVAFDLDDTLYRELDYVEGGFQAVADSLESEFDIPSNEGYQTMLDSMGKSGRGHQLDDVLHTHGLHTVARRNRLVQVYRQHEPALSLPQASATALQQCRDRGDRLFLVTDGNHRVQARKIEALGLRPYFEHCYLTYRYGRAASKPSTRVFDLMLKRTRSAASDLIYVGDNPTKDFVGVRQLGGHTIRVRTGGHADVVARPGFDADITVSSIAEVNEVVESLSLKNT